MSKDWTEDEFSEVDFGDKRLGQRFLNLVERLARRAGESVQVACEDWKVVKAAYRFFDNPRVSAEKISAPHFAATASRISALDEKFTLVAHDTTYLTYSHHPATVGLGHITKFGRNSEMSIHGVIMHSALALTRREGMPLGFLGQKIFTRVLPPGFHNKSGKNRTRIPIETKESHRWIELMEQSCRQVKNPGNLVHMGDREADVFELFEAASRFDTHYLIRLRAIERNTSDGRSTLFSRIRTLAPKGRYKFMVEKKDGTTREADIEVRFYPVTILPSIAKTHCNPIKAYVISAREKNPPSVEDRIDWRLLTDLPIKNFNQAMEKINWYKLRWRIEVFHKILKSGCKVESCRLQNADRLIRYLAVQSVVAWRIFWMSFLERSTDSAPANTALTPEETTALKAVAKKKGVSLTTQNPLPDWIVMIARLGGFLARRGDGRPGPLVLWRGMLRLNDIVLGSQLHPP